MSEEILKTEEPTGFFGRIALFYRQVISELTKIALVRATEPARARIWNRKF